MKYAIIILTLILASCKPECKVTKQGTAKLVGYKVAKSSHMCFQLMETGTNHDIGQMGGRREPNIAIGTTVKCSYVLDTCSFYIDILLDPYHFAKEPNDGTARTVGIYPF